MQHLTTDLAIRNAQIDTSWLQEFHRNIQDPSLRTPGISTRSNVADEIERQLQNLNHRYWGFVIYRTTYDSDGEWADCLDRLRSQLNESLTDCNGNDILERHVLTVFDDKLLFDGASTDTARQHFQEWSATAWMTEQFPEQIPQQRSPPQPGEHDCGEGIRDMDHGGLGMCQIRVGSSPRYRYAIQVDAEALSSILAPDPEEDARSLFGRKRWVRVLDKTWYRGRSVTDAELFPAIDGVTEEDVGWMRTSLFTVMDSTYVGLGDDENTYTSDGAWDIEYLRPPEVVGAGVMTT